MNFVVPCNKPYITHTVTCQARPPVQSRNAAPNQGVPIQVEQVGDGIIDTIY